MNWAAITAIGTVLAGLALPLAFIQIGALRQERLRAQVSKIGVWTRAGALADPPREWAIALFIRNASELPIQVFLAELAIPAWWGPDLRRATGLRVPKTDDSEETRPAYLRPGTILPGETWQSMAAQSSKAESLLISPAVAIKRVVVTDAAGHQWEIRSAKVGPPRRVRQWRHWWWKRHGKL